MRLTSKEERRAWQYFAGAAIQAPWFQSTLGELQKQGTGAELWTLAALTADAMVLELRERTKPPSVPPAPWAEMTDAVPASPWGDERHPLTEGP